MLKIPSDVQRRFESFLRRTEIPRQLHRFYFKWLQYYLDFCEKYHFTPTCKDSLAVFLNKLRAKKQTEAQQQQASHAISLYYDLDIVHDGASYNKIPATKALCAEVEASDGPSQRGGPSSGGVSSRRKRREEDRPPQTIHAYSKRGAATQGNNNRYSESPTNTFAPVHTAESLSGKKVPVTGASWEAEYIKLANEIKVRHYSPQTLKTYRQWMSKFQTFTKSKPPGQLAPDDVKEFLTFLAVKRSVAASTQNQAFNSLLFFFRHVLGKEFGKIDGVVRTTMIYTHTVKSVTIKEAKSPLDF